MCAASFLLARIRRGTTGAETRERESSIRTFEDPLVTRRIQNRREILLGKACLTGILSLGLIYCLLKRLLSWVCSLLLGLVWFLFLGPFAGAGVTVECSQSDIEKRRHSVTFAFVYFRFRFGSLPVG